MFGKILVISAAVWLVLLIASVLVRGNAFQIDSAGGAFTAEAPREIVLVWLAALVVLPPALLAAAVTAGMKVLHRLRD